MPDDPHAQMIEDTPVAPEPPANPTDPEIFGIGAIYRNAWRHGWSEGYRAALWPYRCRFCGRPSKVAPEDQQMPPDYCHPEDHQ